MRVCRYYAGFSVCPMVEANQSLTSTSKKSNFLPKISGMGYMEHTQEKQCSFPQKGLASTQKEIRAKLYAKALSMSLKGF